VLGANQTHTSAIEFSMVGLLTVPVTLIVAVLALWAGIAVIGS
jgi:arsenical pump membrane protein